MDGDLFNSGDVKFGAPSEPGRPANLDIGRPAFTKVNHSHICMLFKTCQADGTRAISRRHNLYSSPGSQKWG